MSKKFKSVNFNNKTKEISLKYIGNKEVTLHYSDLGFKKLIDKAWVDKDTRGASVGFLFRDGSEEFMPYDQPLFLKNDPEYLLQTHIEQLIFEINQRISEKKISKKYLARKLGTSDNQVQRILDTSILNKNLKQLYTLAALIDLDISLKAA